MNNSIYSTNQTDKIDQTESIDLNSVNLDKSKYDQIQLITELVYSSGLENTSIINITTLLNTDFYQITMAYAYFKSNVHMHNSTFEMYFRKCPFGGEYVVFAGIDKIVDVLKYCKFSKYDINILKNIFDQKNMNVDEKFYDYLENMKFDDVTVKSVAQGEIVFPRTPVIVVNGPILKCQLLETLFLGLVSFPCLVATNARRMVSFSKNVKCLEYGFRRAQGVGAANDATKYSQIGGFIGTSNVLEGYLNSINLSGTIAHSFVTSFNNLDQIDDNIELTTCDGTENIKFKQLVLQLRMDLRYDATNDGELAAFISYALAYPNNFFGLVDSYNVLESGIKNYIVVAYALYKCGYSSVGIRIDSGDLGYLSVEIRKMFNKIDKLIGQQIFANNIIVASNEISTKVILSLNQQENEIDVYAIGTKLVTCAETPSLGMVYKLVEINGNSVMKFSQDNDKITIPYEKNVFRFYNSDGIIVLDYMTRELDLTKFISTDGNIVCRHPMDPTKSGVFNVHNGTIKPLLHYVWKDGKPTTEDLSIQTAKIYNADVFKTMRTDMLRYENPTPAKVSVDPELFEIIQNKIKQNALYQSALH